MPRKRARNEDAEELYPVEVIVSAKRTGNKIKNDPSYPAFGAGWLYHVQWYGFPEEQNTWEPISSLGDCQRLLKSFWTEIGHESLSTTASNFVVTPRPDWIAHEKRRFIEDATTSQTSSSSKKSRTNRHTPLQPRKVTSPKSPRMPTHKIRLLPSNSSSSPSAHVSSSPSKRANPTWTEQPQTPPESQACPSSVPSPHSEPLTPPPTPEPTLEATPPAERLGVLSDVHEPVFAPTADSARVLPAFATPHAMPHMPVFVPDDPTPHPTPGTDVYFGCPPAHDEPCTSSNYTPIDSLDLDPGFFDYGTMDSQLFNLADDPLLHLG